MKIWKYLCIRVLHFHLLQAKHKHTENEKKNANIFIEKFNNFCEKNKIGKMFCGISSHHHHHQRVIIRVDSVIIISSSASLSCLMITLYRSRIRWKSRYTSTIVSYLYQFMVNCQSVVLNLWLILELKILKWNFVQFFSEDILHFTYYPQVSPITVRISL